MTLTASWTVRPWGVVAVAVFLWAGCTEAHEELIEAPTLFSSSDDVERARSSVGFDTLWVFGGASDTLLASPARPRPDGADGIVFFDTRNQVAYRLGANGDLLWSWGSRGEGPGELSLVRAMDVAPDGTVVLVDSGNRRVVRLSADGRLLAETPVPQGVNVESVAALPDAVLAVTGSDLLEPALALWDGDNAVKVRLPASLQSAHAMHVHGKLARWGDTGWVLGLYAGNGWLTFRGAEPLGVFPYAEHLDIPDVRQVRQGSSISAQPMTRPTETGLSLSVVDDTLFVLFGGKSQLRGRILDKFDVRSGAYLETDLLPHFANFAVVGENRVFTVEAWDVFPRIVALSRRARSQP